MDFNLEELKWLRRALDTEAIRLESIKGSEAKIEKVNLLTNKVEMMMASLKRTAEESEPEYYYRES